MLRNRHTLVAGAALLPLSVSFVAIACSSSDTGPPPGSCTDLASIEVNIFAPSCANAGCHSATSPAAGLNLSAAADLAGQLVGVPAATCDGKSRVVPGNPDGSFLYEKINSAKPACGDHMPTGGDLSAEQKACIKDWIASLPPGGCETCGGSQCLDLKTDAAHCGACNKACPSGASCGAGACTCAGGLTACGSTCSDTSSDPLNCGGCGKPCPMNQVCNLGACSASCGALTNCNGACVDTNTSPTHCGACGKACTLGQTCMSGMCTCGSTSVSFAAAIQPIFTAHCGSAGCHGGVMPQVGLDLSPGKAHAELVNVNATQCNDGRKRVLPGQPSESYVIDKMTNVDLCFGTKMPKLGTIPNGDITTVADWICAGAPNN